METRCEFVSEKRDAVRFVRLRRLEDRAGILRQRSHQVPFADVRANLGATCTMVTSYLIEQQVNLPARVATAPHA